MVRPQLATAAALAVGTLVGCTASAAPTTVPVAHTITVTPDVVDVDCSANGTVVSTPVVAAQSDGVHVRARNTSGTSGIYLNYSHEPRFGPGGGSGGGDGVGTGVSIRVLKIAPGTAQFQCGADLNRQLDVPVSIEVRDPAHAWRTGALARLDCAPATRAYLESLRGPAHGATAEAALAALAARTDRTSTWRAAQEGYVAATQQIYVLRRGGISWASAQVDHIPTGGFGASLWMLCQDDHRRGAVESGS